MNNLLILFTLISIGYVCFNCGFEFLRAKGFKRKLVFLKFVSVFFACAMIIVPLTSYYNFKNPDKHIWNLTQTYFSIKPIKSFFKNVDKKITKSTDRFVPAAVKKTISPIQRQTAQVLNEAIPRKRFVEANPGIFQMIGGVFSSVGTVLKGAVGIFI